MMIKIWIFIATMIAYFSVHANEIVYHQPPGEVKIVLEDYLAHPFYWWPQTLICYPVTFDGTIAEKELVVEDSRTGRQVPYQLGAIKTEDSKLKYADIYLLSDLPSEGKHEYIIKKGMPQAFDKIRTVAQGQEIIVTTDKLAVKIPASQDGTSALPAPVIAIAQDGKKWMGKSYFEGTKKPLRLETKQTATGPLFAEYSLTYTFADSGQYEVRIRCIQGYDFIEIKEKMNGLKSGDQSWRMEWTDFSPTHRQAPNHPYHNANLPTGGSGTGFDRYVWEKIDEDLLMSHHVILRDTSSVGKIPFDIGIYGNWPAERTLTSSLFWDEADNQSIGLFAQNISLWNDQHYAIWYTERILNIELFYHQDRLKWKYPLATGTRSSAISVYDHQKDITFMNELEKMTQPAQTTDGFTYKANMGQLSYNTFLQNRYGTIHLDKVKDWRLSYPDSLVTHTGIFDAYFESLTPERFMQQFFYGEFSSELPVSGPCQNNGYSAVPTRGFYSLFTPGFEAVFPKLTEQQRKQAIAMFLAHAYITDGEELMPIRGMLSGHPNFLSDVRCVPAFAAYLFPKHPEARNWADGFEKYNQLNAHYHTRPDVKSWDAQGGRWTESIATYFWGNFRAPQRANYLLQHYFDGKNRMANEAYAKVGRYAIDAISAPFDGEDPAFYFTEKGTLPAHAWGLVTDENRPHRIYPPQGAHAIRRIPPSGYWLMGMNLQYYDPLLSENIRYLARPEYQDAEILNRSGNAFNQLIYPLDSKDTGTPPEWKSVKMTGYGIVLRAAVGTPDELSIHLQQIDEGPNYRWGTANDGGCGNIYFYAAGKSYSNNGREDSGDRRVQDTDMNTNFGAYRNGVFTSIGMNDLTRPMYDLALGQFAEITSSTERGYSAPYYNSRSIMLVGSDYFLVYDDVRNQNISTRFSWFTHPNDPFPEIKIIRSGVADYTYRPGKTTNTILSGSESKGIWFDGSGDFLTFVSHKKGFECEHTGYGCVITFPKTTDYIFRNDQPVKVDSADIKFEGTAGFIRKPAAGSQEMVVFHGVRIGNDRFEILPHSVDAGLSAVYNDTEHVEGRFYSLQEEQVTFRWKEPIAPSLSIYIDGVKHPVKMTKNEMTVSFRRGNHIWNITDGYPVLPQVQILGSTYKKGSADVFISPVGGTEKYRIEYSVDQGKTWADPVTTGQPLLKLRPRRGETKGYIRVSAVNKEHIGIPSAVYPVYYTSDKPHYPEGLRLIPEEKGVAVSWGKVLGCNEYRLYKQTKDGNFQLIYKGSENSFTDKSAIQGKTVEYAVSAFNGNGESDRSETVTTNPASILNFSPIPGESFRRSGAAEADILPTFVPKYYPE